MSRYLPPCFELGAGREVLNLTLCFIQRLNFISGFEVHAKVKACRGVLEGQEVIVLAE
jgi:hypothetical protein